MSECDAFLDESKLYDIFNSKCTNDIFMYLDICKKATTILELGVGTGRLSIPLAEAGINVVGIDNSSMMLNNLNEKIKNRGITNITSIFQDMRFLSLNQIFDWVICPFCTFNFLLTIDDQEKTLNALRPHLSSNAKVVFDVMTPFTFSDVMQKNEQTYFDNYNDPEYMIDIYTSSNFDQSNQLFMQERIFNIKTKKTEQFTQRKIVMKNRIFLLGEFELLLNKCGYRIANVYGDYRLSPFTSLSNSLIVIACPV